MGGDINVLKNTEEVVEKQNKTLEKLDRNLQVPKFEK